MRFEPPDQRESPDDHLEQRFLTLNRDRLRRVLDALTPRQRDFVDVLPLLFHINHPALPGYVAKDTPFGINDYTPNEIAMRAARRIGRSFGDERRSVPRYSIRGLYMMGSPGTIAYTRHSDLDFWLCYDPEMASAAVELLAEKARRIERFAADLGLEVHFFVFDAERFRRGETLSLSSESSGTSQHLLLLDEFYRSSLLVAGLCPLWWRVPSNAEYDAFVAEASARSAIDTRDYIDFGDLTEIPVDEFFGAAVWQLYKSIQSPCKSVLKLMLMEAYAAEYPRIKLLSQRCKQNLETGTFDLNSLDPYILMYTKVEEHLMARNDPVRLAVLRRAFYIKANLRLSTDAQRAADDWRIDVLSRMVMAWDWSPDQVAHLDAREDWRIDTALDERRDMIKTLKDSYAMLSQFARDQGTDHKISERDLHVLGRQLYAAFERKPAKIEVVTRGICANPAEPALSVHEVKLADDNLVWLLFAGQVRPPELAFRRPLKRCQSAAELLLWCHLNRLADAVTTWQVFPQTSALNVLEVKRINDALACGLDVEIADDDALHARPRIARVMLLANVGIPPFANAVTGSVVLTSDRADPFEFGARRINLVRSLDLIVVTTWAETFCHHYEGDSALGEALATCMEWMSPDTRGEDLPPIEVRCFSSDYAFQICERVTQTFVHAFRYLNAAPPLTTPHYVLEIEDRLHHVKVEDGKPEVAAHDGQALLVRALGAGDGSRFHAVHFDGRCTRAGVLPELYARNRAGCVQIFARQRNQHADVYIIDESGRLLVQRQECHAMAMLMHHYREFLTAALPRCAVATDSPLLVETCEIVEANGARQFKPYGERSGSMSPYLSLQVLADADSHGHQHFTINANHREFSTWEHGGSLFAQVAEFVLAQRKQGDVYPIYITDLDLSTRFRQHSGLTHLRAFDLLGYKKRIEHQLTRALTREVVTPITLAS